jgi:hypothetical protein
MFGVPRKEHGSTGYTYTALVCDKEDTLHLVSRWSGYERGRNCLVSLRKKAGQPWDTQKLLVVPFRSAYSLYNHKINVDRLGRLFVNYSYYGTSLTEAEAEAYKKKWPEDNLRKPPGKEVGPWPKASRLGIKAHEPCMLISDDGGNTWRLALTKDFTDGIKTMKYKGISKN